MNGSSILAKIEHVASSSPCRPPRRKVGNYGGRSIPYAVEDHSSFIVFSRR
jgi:hypothetical protein